MEDSVREELEGCAETWVEEAEVLEREGYEGVAHGLRDAADGLMNTLDHLQEAPGDGE